MLKLTSNKTTASAEPPQNPEILNQYKSKTMEVGQPKYFEVHCAFNPEKVIEYWGR